jgi:dipeptidyl aminopeptidase/acylaminoacyl peptidase
MPIVPGAGLPPLVDRELFFGNPEITDAKLSPDGRFLAFLKPWQGTRNVWVKETDEPFDRAHLLTSDTRRPIPAFSWSRDGRYVLFVQDQDGDENYNVYAVGPSDPVAEGDASPVARNLTDAKGVRAFVYATPKAEPDIIYVGLNDRDRAWHDLYKVHLTAGTRTLVRENMSRVTGWVFDNRGRLRLAVRTDESGDTELLRVDDDALVPIYRCSVFESCIPLRFDPQNQRVYIETSKGDTDLSRLVLLDPATADETLVESDPLGRVDFGRALFSEESDALVATIYTDEKDRVYPKDEAFEADYRLLRARIPNHEISVTSSTADERRWLITVSSDTEPGETHLFDRDSKTLRLQYRIREKLPRPALASTTPVSYPSSDGLIVPAYLTLPAGVPATNLPAVLLPHGGPWARDVWGFNGIAQFLANRGYAVLQPNFRSSVGFGKRYLNAGNHQWGLLMQDDLTWGVKYLIQSGIADSKRIGIMGGSYGGYATLAGVAFTPDLYAAAVSIVGPSNLLTLLESIPPYWEAARQMFYVRMGDPRTEDGKAQLQRQSPLNSAGAIKTPLLVVQGANDPRVKKHESDQIVVALRDRGFPVEYLVAPDEGHGFARPVNNMALFAATEKFLATHLGGRYQPDMPPEVAAQLGEIMVDPRTVRLAPGEPARPGTS